MRGRKRQVRSAGEVYVHTAAGVARHCASDIEDLGRSPMGIPSRHPYMSLRHPMRRTREHPILRILRRSR